MTATKPDATAVPDPTVAATAVPDPTTAATPDASRWTVLRRRVCLAGCVTAADGTTSRGGRLSLVAAAPPVAPAPAPVPAAAAAPAAGRKTGRKAAASGAPLLSGAAVVPPDEPAVPTRAWETLIRPDGRYWFFDVPAGDYVLSGRDERGRVVEARPVALPTVDVRDGRKPLLGVDLVAVPPATVPVAATATATAAVAAAA